MITISMLDHAFQSIEQIGKQEVSFEVAGTPVTMRMLTASEEILVQRYAQDALTNSGDNDQTAAMEYLDRFKNALLSYSIVQVGNQDLRGVSYVETAEMLPNGTPVRVAKDKAIRDLVGKWPRKIILLLFKKYGELSGEVEDRAEKSVDFEPSDYDAEIARLKDRIGELERRKATATMEDPMTVRLDTVQDSAATRPAPIASRVEPTPVQQSETQSPPIPSTPKVSASYVEEEPQTPQQRPILPQRKPPVVPQQQQSVSQPQGSASNTAEESLENLPFDDIQDSILGDEQAQIEAENRRLMAKRQAQQQNRQDVRRVPPHVSAKQTALEHAGSFNGIEAYRMPHQELSKQPVQSNPNQVVVDDTPKGAVNPRFIPSRNNR